ncbi:hypothetical protein C7B69_21025 [filamentous cyanobacterium Phorm 46]|nr:hypothetical protein C7B69_21025 [filamentous cyanobacterium Phorm 46]PSB43172.1 hypothetical protein C7B67_24210 [filamentous cyanobacterium Phorm 6]
MVIGYWLLVIGYWLLVVVPIALLLKFKSAIALCPIQSTIIPGQFPSIAVFLLGQQPKVRHFSIQ